MEECWKKINGFDQYEVSCHGSVRSFKKDPNGRILRLDRSKDGYFRATMQKDGIPHKKFVHVLVAESFLGPGEGKEVDHKNSDPADNNVDNLQFVSQRENVRLSWSRGRREHLRYDLKIRNRKLSDKQVLEIFRRVKVEGLRRLAEEFQVSSSTISNIKRKKHYKNLWVK